MNGRCPWCDHPAYVGLRQVECWNEACVLYESPRPASEPPELWIAALQQAYDALKIKNPKAARQVRRKLRAALGRTP